MLSTVPSVIRSCWARFSFLGSYGVSKEPPDPFLHKFHALGSGFCLLSLSYFSYNFSKHLPYSISPKWEIIVPLFERNWNEVICPLKWQLQAEMFSVEQRSSELKPASLFHEWSPPVSLLLLTFPLPPLISHYMRFFFFFSRDELWLVLNVLGVKHPVFLWVIWPCQRPTAFPNDIMGFSWELLEKSDYGSQGDLC